MATLSSVKLLHIANNISLNLPFMVNYTPREDTHDESIANDNAKEMILVLRGIDRLLQDNNRILQENNQLMKGLDDKLRAIAFNTKD